jgi:hypothetical protein
MEWLQKEVKLCRQAAKYSYRRDEGCLSDLANGIISSTSRVASSAIEKH